MHPEEKTHASDVALSRSLAHFARPRGPHLLDRTRKFFDWTEARRSARAWPYFRSIETAPLTHARIRQHGGEYVEGLNFCSQDYLSLATHPAVREGAVAALDEFGVHSAGSLALVGSTRLSRELETELSQFLGLDAIALFPTGWAAGFGAIAGLVRAYDYVVMDNLAHNCLQTGAHFATPNVIRHEHLDVEAARIHLAEIRGSDAKGGILLVTEGLYSMDSDTPQLRPLVEACREYEATLLVDVAHDLGSLGPQGTGQLGIQEVLAEVDLVIGAFSKTFASNGGFLATRHASVRDFVRVYGASITFSTALSPIQAGTALAALRIVRSAEGDERRTRLLRAAGSLRSAFSELGIECLGIPSAIVAVPAGADSVARVASGLIAERGVLTNLVEFPAVPVASSRFRMQVMADHTPEESREAAAIVARAVADAKEMLAAEGSPW